MKLSEQSDFLARLRGRKFLSTSLILLTLSVGILIGTLVDTEAGAAREGQKAAPDATPLTIPPPQPVENQFTEIARAVRPSVVNIRVEALPQKRAPESGRQDQPGQQGDERMEEFFRRFFGMPGGPGGSGDGPVPRQRPNNGEGSGIIVDQAGYLLTNYHVVERADRVRVRFGEDDELYDAKVIGHDEETDLAVVKVDAPEHLIRPAKIGNSEAVSVGDWAIAIGSPFGFRETVTVGIISAKSREVQGGAPFSRPFQKFFQTDAAINPGNSGGPLVNIRGEVIGVNTAIVSRTGGYEGLGFALPSNIAAGVYNQIIERGKVARGSIGVTFSSVQEPANLRVYGAKDGGVLVTDIKEGGPAEQAGMKVEDVIVSIDGKKIKDGDQLIAIVAATPVDSTVPIEVLRDGKTVTLDVAIADRSELFAKELGFSGPEEAEEPEISEVMFGFKVAVLTSAQKEKLEYEDSGLLIIEVDPASFADDIGLRKNDIIVSINRKPVEGLSDVREIQNGLSLGDDVAFKVMRRGPGGWTALYPAGVLPDKAEDRF